MKDIRVGITYTSKQSVTDSVLACSLGSGDMEVFATPAMIALMENAAMNCVTEFMEGNETTVGISVKSTHIRATAKGDRVEATAKIESVEGRKIVFSITASDSTGVIGEATHERFVVDREKFLSKLKNPHI